MAPPASAPSGDKDAALNAIDTNPEQNKDTCTTSGPAEGNIVMGPDDPPATSW
ncbi:hypothetical protein [Streptomyces litmocidini]|uniref:hypothetical protein n=1 Tax=Streptomyces litmocidini TaxID=67318 RepID=UPI0036FFA29B